MSKLKTLFLWTVRCFRTQVLLLSPSAHLIFFHLSPHPCSLRVQLSHPSLGSLVLQFQALGVPSQKASKGPAESPLLHLLRSPLLQCMRCGDCEHSLWARSAGPRLFWLWISELIWGKQRDSGSPGTSFIKPALSESVKEGKLSCSVFIFLKPHIKPLQLAACQFHFASEEVEAQRNYGSKEAQRKHGDEESDQEGPLQRRLLLSTVLASLPLFCFS